MDHLFERPRCKSAQMSPAPVRWTAQWMTSRGPKHIMWRHGEPLLFHTRREARAWIEENYGYIKTRPDLRAHPHNWRLPRAIRVAVILKELP